LFRRELCRNQGPWNRLELSAGEPHELNAVEPHGMSAVEPHGI
jgi:hypothetical protein